MVVQEEDEAVARRQAALEVSRAWARRPESLIHVPDVSATDAARRFSDLLDAVEHRGEAFTIVRHGKAVARLEMVGGPSGAVVKALIATHRATWIDELAAIRSLLVVDDRR